MTIILTMQGQLDTLNENTEKLIEQMRIANQQRFGRSTETMKVIDGQMFLFNEADKLYEVDMEDFSEEIIPAHAVPVEKLDAFYGKGNWKRMTDETYKRLRHT